MKKTKALGRLFILAVFNAGLQAEMLRSHSGIMGNSWNIRSATAQQQLHPGGQQPPDDQIVQLAE